MRKAQRNGNNTNSEQPEKALEQKREREALLSSYKRRKSLHVLASYERKIREQPPKIMLPGLLKDRSLQDGLLSTAGSLDSIFVHLNVGW